MSRLDRLYRIKQIIEQRRSVSRDYLQSELGISRSTFRRDLDYLRDQMNAPIVYDGDKGGYRLDSATPQVGPKFELPGVWFTAPEMLAMLTMDHLIEQLEPGLLASHVDALRERLASMLESTEDSAREVRRRVRIITLAARKRDLRCFQAIGAALLRRKRLLITHFSRKRNETSEREVSPQRLVHYRENWLLDAWCHQSNAIRTFGVEAIIAAMPLDTPAMDVGDAELDAVLKDGYGIFGGKAHAWAKLKFSPLRARWVATETWHERQKASFDGDGSYILEIPYSDDRELVMDIMRFGSDCEVLEPKTLRDKVKAMHIAAGKKYTDDKD